MVRMDIRDCALYFVVLSIQKDKNIYPSVGHSATTLVSNLAFILVFKFIARYRWSYSVHIWYAVSSAHAHQHL